jgi:hypothetical protein
MANPQGILFVSFSLYHPLDGRLLILNGSTVASVDCNPFRFCLRQQYAPNLFRLMSHNFV